MNFETWTTPRVDTVRLRRLFVGSVVGCVTVIAALAFVILSSKGAQAIEEEEEGPIEVQLEKQAEPEPPPPPPPPPDAPKPAPRPRMASPLAVPDDKPEEKDPTPATTAPEVEEDERPVAAVASTAPPRPPPPPPKAKPTVKKPIRLTEDMPKPVQTVMKTPEYPSSAKLAGIEGVVIVKYVVGEDGSVKDAKVLKGPPELQESCLAAVKTWRFQPMIVDGQAISFVKIARFPFRIR